MSRGLGQDGVGCKVGCPSKDVDRALYFIRKVFSWNPLKKVPSF